MRIRIKTADSSPGWDPDAPLSPQPTRYLYNPAEGFPGYDYPTLSGKPSDEVVGYFRWTREGLKGADFGAQ